MLFRVLRESQRLYLSFELTVLAHKLITGCRGKHLRFRESSKETYVKIRQHTKTSLQF